MCYRGVRHYRCQAQHSEDMGIVKHCKAFTRRGCLSILIHPRAEHCGNVRYAGENVNAPCRRCRDQLARDAAYQHGLDVQQAEEEYEAALRRLPPLPPAIPSGIDRRRWEDPAYQPLRVHAASRRHRHAVPGKPLPPLPSLPSAADGAQAPRRKPPSHAPPPSTLPVATPVLVAVAGEPSHNPQHNDPHHGNQHHRYPQHRHNDQEAPPALSSRRRHNSRQVLTSTSQPRDARDVPAMQQRRDPARVHHKLRRREEVAEQKQREQAAAAKAYLEREMKVKDKKKKKKGPGRGHGEDKGKFSVPPQQRRMTIAQRARLQETEAEVVAEIAGGKMPGSVNAILDRLRPSSPAASEVSMVSRDAARREAGLPITHGPGSQSVEYPAWI